MFIFLGTTYRAIIFAVATATTIFWGLGRHYRSLISLSFLDRMGIGLCISFMEPRPTNTGNRRRFSAIDVTLLSGLGKLLKWGFSFTYCLYNHWAPIVNRQTDRKEGRLKEGIDNGKE
jgi:hypothetical protein